MTRSATALLTKSLPLSKTGGAAQLLPAGEFKARDGRPGKTLTWKVTDAVGQRLAAQLNTDSATQPFVIDYEHQTMLSAENGQKAPASGWSTQFDWKPGEGLFATVDWTATAQQHIDADEYRYISPVIDYDTKTGEITGVHNAALTNFPALTGMKSVVARLSAQFSPSDNDDQEPTVDLSALLTQLGLAAGSTPEQIAAHINGLRTTADAVANLRTSLGLAAEAPLTDVVTAIATLRSTLDLSQTATLTDIGTTVVALRAKAGTPDAATLQSMQALQTEVARLTNDAKTREINEVVDSAIAAHKLLPAQRDWAVSMGTKDIQLLRSYVATASPVQGLGGQTGGKGAGDAQTTDQAALSVAASMGVTAEQFAKAAPKTAA